VASNSAEATPLPWRATRRGHWLVVALTWLVVLLSAGNARAQEAQDQEPTDTVTRDARFEFDEGTGLLYLDGLLFRDIIDPALQSKLTRGLPTTIVLSAAIYRAGTPTPLSTTVQSCKVTWHVWEEAYFVEVTRPGSTRSSWTTTVEGVLRRCTEIHRLLAGDLTQIPRGVELLAAGKIQVNPVSAELLQKIKRWVMRPSATGTAAPGDALFSTFTGLFLQRIGDAERQQKFTTRPSLPVVFNSKNQ